MTDQPINVYDRIADLAGEWDPIHLTTFNDCDVVLIEIDGLMPFHSFPDFDDVFLVLRGEMRMEYEDRPPVPMTAGDMIVVPRGLRHRAVSDTPCQVLVFERSLASRQAELDG
ncbi:MAG: cupin domain-containing protein [Marinibacterium sp.]|nr:cupin domain-containing protein [Marinibacterium sp.]